MKILFLVGFILSALVGVVVRAGDATGAVASEVEYTKKLEERADKVLAALTLGDEGKATRVRGELISQYRRLRAWHEAHDEELKGLRKAASGLDAEAATRAKGAVAEVMGGLKAQRDRFLAALAVELSPGQVDTVKDVLTYNKVQVTYRVYCEIFPTLTEVQKGKMMGWLIEAREEAIDGGSNEEKSEIFNRYKGRINNYFSKEGFDAVRARKEWAARQGGAGK